MMRAQFFYAIWLLIELILFGIIYVILLLKYWDINNVIFNFPFILRDVNILPAIIFEKYA